MSGTFRSLPSLGVDVQATSKETSRKDKRKCGSGVGHPVDTQYIIIKKDPDMIEKDLQD